MNNLYLKSFLIFLFTFLIYLFNLNSDYQASLLKHDHRRLITTDDAFANTFLPFNLLKNKSFAFNKIMNSFYSMQDSTKLPYYLVRINENYVSKYPIFTGLLATPIYLPLIYIYHTKNLYTFEDSLNILLFGRIAASFYAALSVCLFYLIIEKILRLKNLKINKLWKFLFIVFYAFGTATYTISSRTLWQHTSAQFLLSFAILFFLNGLEKSKNIKWTGLFLSMVVLCRPTSLIFVAIFTIYIFFCYKKEFLKYLLFTLPSITFLLVYNYYIFGNPLTEGYQAAGDTSFTFNFIDGITGLLLSPNRSLLFLSPPLFLGIYFIFSIFKKTFSFISKKTFLSQDKFYYFHLTMALVVVFQMVLMANWYCWWGGDSFGYRMLTEILPILALLSFEVFQGLKPKYKVIVSIFIVYSILVHANAVFYSLSRCENQNAWEFECLYPAKEVRNFFKL